jgi:hypothetical protein
MSAKKSDIACFVEVPARLLQDDLRCVFLASVEAITVEFEKQDAPAFSGTVPLRLPVRLRAAEDVGVWTAPPTVAATVKARLGTDGANLDASSPVL